MPRRPPLKRKLSELLIRRQRPQAKPYLIWDTKQHGLVLRIQPTGHRAYVCVYSYHGRPRWLHLGRADALGLREARQLAAEAMLAVAKGGDPAAHARQREHDTFTALAARYVAEHAQHHNKSYRQAAHLVQRWVIPTWGTKPPATITRADLRALLAGRKPMLANAVLAGISAIFSWAVDQDLLPANPCRGLRRNPETPRERVLSDSELPKFWRAFDDCGLVASAALKLILLTGQRPGEVCHMRFEHIIDGWWELPGQPQQGWPGTKNAATHRVWLAPAVWAVLADFERMPKGYVLAGPRGAPIRSLAAAMQAVCTRVGAPRATPHDLRRTFSSRVTGLGYGREAMNRVTNHKEGGIASVYDRYQYTEENKRIWEAVAAHIMGLV
jgi:integrase